MMDRQELSYYCLQFRSLCNLYVYKNVTPLPEEPRSKSKLPVLVTELQSGNAKDPAIAETWL